MDTSPSDRRADAGGSTSSRRDFLHQTAGIAAGIATMATSVSVKDQPASTSSLLPTIQLGPHRVTRLIIGGNPVYGYSHFNKHFDRHMTAWHTPERVMDLLKRCEECGLNTFQNSYSERTLGDLERYCLWPQIMRLLAELHCITNSENLVRCARFYNRFCGKVLESRPSESRRIAS